MIYFAQLPTGAIKIGYSADVDQRARSLGFHYGCDLEILHTMEGDRETERALHERFAHLRFGRTEQFRPGPDLAEFIGLPLFVSANPETVTAVSPSSGLRAVRLELEEDVHKLLRLEAAKRDMSLAALAREIVEEGLRRRAKP